MQDNDGGVYISAADGRAAERLVRKVKEEFAKRQTERRLLERGWELNMNFLAGNQYCDINPAGELEEEEPRYSWQYRRVFNHIAPAIDTRCAKLSSMRPALSVRAASDQESDLRTAKISSNVLKAVCEECDMDGVIDKATVWSETCGTAFYKIVWDETGGKKIGAADGSPVYEGAVRVAAVSPFEIYPDDLSAETMEELSGLIHARAMRTDEIERLYGVRVPGREIREFSFAPRSSPMHFIGGQGSRAETGRKNGVLSFPLASVRKQFVDDLFRTFFFQNILRLQRRILLLRSGPCLFLFGRFGIFAFIGRRGDFIRQLFFR